MTATFTLSPALPLAHSRGAAAALAALAIGFNLPFARLASIFDYPDILRHPPQAILQAFTEGGPGLILTWYAFAIAALIFAPVAIAHALAGRRLQDQPALAIAAAIAGAFAGVLQAMGLLRWVMVVPGLAAAGDVQGFALLHAYAGVAIGEHLGQLLTALHIGLVVQMQWREGTRATSLLGAMTTTAITLGAFEGLALAIGADGATFGLFAITGYLGLTLWMLASAWRLWR